jgi:hypothetical protein
MTHLAIDQTRHRHHPTGVMPTMVSIYLSNSFIPAESANGVLD